MTDNDQHSEPPETAEPSGSAQEQSAQEQADRLEERFSKPILRGDVGVEAAQVWVSGFLIVALGFVAYVNALNIPFHTPDQEAIVNNPALHHFTGLAEAAESVPGGPVPTLSLGLLWLMTGGSAMVFQLASIFLHLANAILVFLLSRKLISGAPEAVHMLAGLLVALHPLATESVHLAVGQAGLWTAFFALASALAFVRVSDGGGVLRFGAWAASIIFFVLAWGSSPAAAMLPAFLLVMDSYRRGLPAVRQAWRLHLPFWAALVGLGVMRFAAEGALFNGPIFVQWAGEPGTALTAMAQFIYLALVPIGLSIVHDMPEPAAILSGPALGGLVAIAGLAIFAVILVRRGQLPGLAIAWFLLFLLGAFLLNGADDPMSERHAYLPLIGLGLVLPWLGRLAAGESRYLAPAGAVIAALIIGAGAGAFMRNGYWQEEAVIWGDAETKAPSRIEPVRELGRLRIEQGRHAMEQAQLSVERGEQAAAESLTATARRHFEAAAERFREAAAATPGDPEVHLLLGQALLRADEDEEAEEQFLQALRIDLDNQRALLELASLMERRGLMEGDAEAMTKAVDLYRRADELGPMDWETAIRYAFVLFTHGKYEEAELAIERAAAKGAPDTIDPQRQQFAGYAQGLRSMRAEVVRGLRADPQSREHRLQLAHLRMFTNQPLQASYVLAELLERAPQDAEAWALLGMAMANLGEAEAFVAEWEAPATPGEPSPWHYLARQCAHGGAWGAALNYLSMPPAQQAGVAEPELVVARTAIETNQFQIAHQLINVALQRYPESPNPWLSFTDLYVAAGDHETAAQMLGQARALGAAEESIALREQALGAPAAEPVTPTDEPVDEEPEIILR